jgi:hypothetical protein
MSSIEYNYHGSCGNIDCGNYAVDFDAVSVEGVLQNIICGACGIDFTDRCVEKWL